MNNEFILLGLLIDWLIEMIEGGEVTLLIPFLIFMGIQPQ